MRARILLAGLIAVSTTMQLRAQQGPSDSQIAHIVVTANQVDIDAGKVAEKQGSVQEVRDFGKLMVADHAAVNQSATVLVKKLKVTPEANDTSASLSKGGEENVAKLKSLRGKAFDMAYVEHEVAYHQAVIDAVDQTLIPSAGNDELKALLVKVRPAFVQHLEHAKMLQSQLAK